MTGKSNGQNGHLQPLSGASAAITDPRPPLEPHRLMKGVRLVVLGGTGFLGKIFLSMLLYRFPEIGRVYLLVRKGKAESSEARFFEQIAESETFRPIREKHGEGFVDFLRRTVVPSTATSASRCAASTRPSSRR
jgi:long-chain acyl-CoA synthetase